MGKRRQLTKAVAAKGKTGKFRAAAKHAKGSTNNPFEVQKNKASKHTVLGRRVQGANRNVAMARSKAVERRKGSLLADMQGALKANKFVDKRWGEDDNAITEEDKMTMRLKLVHQKRKNERLPVPPRSLCCLLCWITAAALRSTMCPSPRAAPTSSCSVPSVPSSAALAIALRTAPSLLRPQCSL